MRIIVTLLLTLLLLDSMIEFGLGDERLGLEKPTVIQKRKSDWRSGPIVYQVIVDRFAPSEDLEGKKEFYAAPRRLKPWSEAPRRGRFLKDHSVWRHEIDFWGGDLRSLASKIDYIEDLGADVLYLNPIFESFTNHKYGAMDYRKISPEYGTREDLGSLAKRVHDNKMHLILDGVFNHMGMRAPAFIEAQKDPKSKFRQWFDFDEKYEHGYRAWYNVPNLPELNLENESLQQELWESEDSIVRSYLRDGVDGWRLDVAFDIGPHYLKKLTDAAHRTKGDAWIVGEVWSDPVGWSTVMDGTMNFNFRQLVQFMLEGKLTGDQAGRIMQNQFDRGDFDSLLRSWLILDNHDLPRLKHFLPKPADRDFAQTLQFTMPGSPCVYYGVEIGMNGGDDPDQRGPMQWDRVTDRNLTLKKFRRLVDIRKKNPALRYGSVRFLPSENLFAFVRYTDETEEIVVIVANPTDEKISDVIAPGMPTLLNFTGMKDSLSNYETAVMSGLLEVQIPARSVMILKPKIDRPLKAYNSFKRIR